MFTFVRVSNCFFDVVLEQVFAAPGTTPSIANTGQHACNFGDLPVQAIDVSSLGDEGDRTDPEDKNRNRQPRLVGGIESALDWASVRSYRQGDNPARWRGRLQKLLPAHTKIQRVRHAALPFADIGPLSRVAL